MGENFSLPSPDSIMPFADWRRENRHLRFIPVHGDSMEPTLRPGDLAVVDATQTTIIGERIYLLEINGAPVIRRVQLWPGRQVRITADHPALRDHPVIMPRDDVIALGVVVICGRHVG